MTDRLGRGKQRRWRIALAVAALALVGPLVTPARAQMSGRLQGDGKHAAVAVWQSPEAWIEAAKLLRSGVDPATPEMGRRYAACVVPGGTRATVISVLPGAGGDGERLYNVTVADGPHKGCVGVVAEHDLLRGE
jgi:hypothetical protein